MQTFLRHNLIVFGQTIDSTYTRRSLFLGNALPDYSWNIHSISSPKQYLNSSLPGLIWSEVTRIKIIYCYGISMIKLFDHRYQILLYSLFFIELTLNEWRFVFITIYLLIFAKFHYAFIHFLYNATLLDIGNDSHQIK